MLLSLFLYGCVDYDIGVQFDNPSQGKIVQHIQLAERLKRFSGATAQQWLDTIEERANQLNGQVEHLPNQGLVVTIPFSNHTDLESKFNQFFSPIQQNEGTAIATADLPAITSHLNLTRNNLLLFERNHFYYDLDLRSLGVFSPNGNLLLSPGALIDLTFHLSTPWGARNIGSNSHILENHQGSKDLVWQLVPGEQNHLEAVFWLPSPLGIGTLVIVILVVVGFYLRYPPRPNQNPLSRKTSASTSV